MYAPGLILLKLRRTLNINGRMVRSIDQKAAILARLQAGQPLEQAIAETLGLGGDGGTPRVLREAQAGQPTVLFVGGIQTNDGAPADGPSPPTNTWVNHQADLTTREDLAGVGMATFNWGGTGGVTIPSLYPSTSVPVANAAGRMEDQLRWLALQGASNIVLAGHSKGGALVMEYLCEVAEGSQPMVNDVNGRPLVVAVSAMDSPMAVARRRWSIPPWCQAPIRSCRSSSGSSATAMAEIGCAMLPRS